MKIAAADEDETAEAAAHEPGHQKEQTAEPAAGLRGGPAPRGGR